MNSKPAAPRPAHPAGRILPVLALFTLLTIPSIHPAIAAGASGTVSVSIRLEIGLSDLHSGGGPSRGLRGAAGAEKAHAVLAPLLRNSLKDRYQPNEVDRIVHEFATRVVVVHDGEAVGSGGTDTAFVTTGDGDVFSL